MYLAITSFRLNPQLLVCIRWRCLTCTCRLSTVRRRWERWKSRWWQWQVRKAAWRLHHWPWALWLPNNHHNTCHTSSCFLMKKYSMQVHNRQHTHNDQKFNKFRLIKYTQNSIIDSCILITCSTRLANCSHLGYKNSSGDEIANVNFFTTISHTYFKTPKREPISFNKLDNSLASTAH